MRRTLLLAAALAAASCAGTDRNLPASATDAKAFLDQVNAAMLKAGVQQARAGWVAQNFITDDTEALDARGTQQVADAAAKFAKDGDALRQGASCPPTSGVSSNLLSSRW